MPPGPVSSTMEPDSITTALLAFRSLAETYILPSLPAPLSAIVQTALNTTTSISPYLVSVYSRFASLATNLVSENTSSSVFSSPEATALLTTLVLIVSTYVSLRILNYVRRAIFSWVMFAFKMVVVLFVVQAAWYINAYGWDRFIRDVTWWGGVVWGLFEEAVDGNNSAGAGGRVPRGMRSRGDARRARSGGFAYGGREQVPLGAGRTRWS